MASEFPIPPSYVTQFLMSGERVVVAVRHHPIELARPILVLLVTTWLASRVAVGLSNGGANVPNAIWFFWLGVFLWTLYRVWWWRRDWLVVTNKRLVTQSGILDRDMPMMPLQKITDMSYKRSFVGLLLGYGNFVLESAGQEQALREVRHVPRPDDVYQAVIEEVFRSPGVAAPDQTIGPALRAPGIPGQALLSEWTKRAKPRIKPQAGVKLRPTRPRHSLTLMDRLLARTQTDTPEQIEARERFQPHGKHWLTSRTHEAPNLPDEAPDLRDTGELPREGEDS